MILLTENAAAGKPENYSNDMPAHFYITVSFWSHLSDMKWYIKQKEFWKAARKRIKEPNEIIKQKLSLALISEQKPAAESK